jgi:hypothetical protein
MSFQTEIWITIAHCADNLGSGTSAMSEQEWTRMFDEPSYDNAQGLSTSSREDIYFDHD